MEVMNARKSLMLSLIIEIDDITIKVTLKHNIEVRNVTTITLFKVYQI